MKSLSPCCTSQGETAFRGRQTGKAPGRSNTFHKCEVSYLVTEKTFSALISLDFGHVYMRFSRSAIKRAAILQLQCVCGNIGPSEIEFRRHAGPLVTKVHRGQCPNGLKCISGVSTATAV